VKGGVEIGDVAGIAGDVANCHGVSARTLQRSLLRESHVARLMLTRARACSMWDLSCDVFMGIAA
jgi:hypothetical protein